MVTWTTPEETANGELGLVRREKREPLIRPRDWEAAEEKRRQWPLLDRFEKTRKG